MNLTFLGKAAELSFPFVVSLAALTVFAGKKADFSDFLAGAREGLDTAVGLLPSLVALIVGVKMLTASGFIDFIASFFTPFLSRAGVPAELIPMLFTRPFSGSASSAAFTDLMESSGADSFPAICASIIMGSSDTFVYIIGVYFSSVGVKKSRYAFPAALAVMIFCIFLSCLTARLFFGE